MINELSILIPCHNCKCKELVKSLAVLLEKEYGKALLHYEILVADDGSTDNRCIEDNNDINSIDKCRYIIRNKNVGRAAIRNFLAQEAQYEWLLFIDSDMVVRSDNYITNYLCHDSSPVVYGGYSVNGNAAKLKTNLRFIYEKASEAGHIYTERQKHPYKDFHTANFIVRRDVMLTYPLDERFRRYGYEDVLWGKTLHQDNIPIGHIDNPLSFEKFEDNPGFISKTEEGLTTLYQFRHELNEYSSIIRYTERIRRLHLTPVILLMHKILSKHIKHKLQGNNPSLFLFNIYKICFFCNLLNKHNQL